MPIVIQRLRLVLLLAILVLSSFLSVEAVWAQKSDQSPVTQTEQPQPAAGSKSETESKKNAPNADVPKSNAAVPNSDVKADTDIKDEDKKANSDAKATKGTPDSSSKKEAPRESGENTSAQSSGAPLVVAGVEVFRISVKLGAYSPERRIESISARLEQLENEPQFKKKVEQITTHDDDYSTDIVAGDFTIMTVTGLDAKAAGVATRQQLAQQYADRLRSVLLKYLEEHSFKNRLISAGLTALSTLVLFVLLAMTGWLFPRSYQLIRSWQGKHIRELRIQRARLLSQETLTDVLIGLLRVIRVLLVLLLLSVYVPVVLSFFPETRALSGNIVDSCLAPVKGVIWPAFLSYLPNVVFMTMISITAYYVITFTHFLFREIERESISIDGFDPEWSQSTYKIVRFLIVTFAFVLMFPYLPGSGSPAFTQVSLFMGVLLSLGSTSAISHVIAGVFLTYTGAFKIGDRVKIADAIGDVVEKTLLATRIRTIKQEYITIPNALVLGSHIINYSSSAASTGLILHTTVTIGYDSPWKQVEQLLIDAALATADVLSDPAPFVLQTSLDDFYVSYQINAYTDKPQLMAVTYSRLHQNIQEKFNQGGSRDHVCALPAVA